MKKIFLIPIIILFINCQSKEHDRFIEKQKKIDYYDDKFMESCRKTDSIEELFLKAVRNAEWNKTEKLSKAYSAEVDNINLILDKKSKVK